MLVSFRSICRTQETTVKAAGVGKDSMQTLLLKARTAIEVLGDDLD